MTQQTAVFWTITPSEQSAVICRLEGNRLVSFAAAVNEEEKLLPQLIAEKMFAEGYESHPVLLAPRSADVLAVSLPGTSAPENLSRTATLYELEEFLPLPIEEWTADLFQESSLRFAGAVQTNRYQSFLDELAAHDVFIHAIVPLALLTAQFFAERPEATQGLRALLWTHQADSPFHDGQVEVFLFTPEGNPLSWQRTEETSKAVRLIIESEIQLRRMPVSAIALGCSEDFRNALQDIPQFSFAANQLPEPEEEELLQLSIASQAAAVLTHRKKAWWDFARDALAMRGTEQILRKSIRLALWGLVLFLLALCITFSVRGVRYHLTSAENFQKQAEVFREALPDQNITTGFRNRLESEHKKLAAQRGQVSEIPKPKNILVPLLTLLEALPQSIRYRFPEIRIEQTGIRLDGQLQVHGDAEKLATALEEGGFLVEPPSTQQTGNSGVSVRLSIHYRPPEGKP